MILALNELNPHLSRDRRQNLAANNGPDRQAMATIPGKTLIGSPPWSDQQLSGHDFPQDIKQGLEHDQRLHEQSFTAPYVHCRTFFLYAPT
jgi:hypothetical protein